MKLDAGSKYLLEILPELNKKKHFFGVRLISINLVKLDPKLTRWIPRNFIK